MGSRLHCPNRCLNPRTKASNHPTMLDIAWAAGIWEGEGSINGARKSRRSTQVSVVQKDTWLLYRLKELFGGGVYLKNDRASEHVCSQWSCSGPRARGFIFTIFSHLSPRRRTQIRKVLEMDGYLYPAI